jgi:hypothetical protein
MPSATAPPQTVHLDADALPLPALPQPGEAAPNAPAIDWSAAARRAATESAAELSLNTRRGAATGDTPWTDPRTTSSPRSFPWSRQPLTPWLDFDVHDLVVIVSLGSHCKIALFLIIAGFGCSLNHIEPDAARGDLFDPKLSSAPLRLPDYTDTDQLHYQGEPR